MTREEMLAVKPALDSIDTPDWGRVWLRTLTGEDAKQVAAWQKDGGLQNTQLVALAVCDESGKRIFSNEDAAKFDSLPARTLLPIASRVAKTNALLESETKEIEGNSLSRTSSSPTNSPLPLGSGT